MNIKDNREIKNNLNRTIAGVLNKKKDESLEEKLSQVGLTLTEVGEHYLNKKQSDLALRESESPSDSRRDNIEAIFKKLFESISSAQREVFDSESEEE
ncbi:hypothetical protein OAQ05_01370 [Acidimicrobiia bacterium]|nr:hypothetical protein [Acidimicrobiia bacterium]